MKILFRKIVRSIIRQIVHLNTFQRNTFKTTSPGIVSKSAFYQINEELE